ncbi:MAG: hypothetical protein OXC62_15270 [Aestuariivita sp.]|nr:hypothetical protein [Aestuariivita sp.]
MMRVNDDTDHKDRLLWSDLSGADPDDLIFAQTPIWRHKLRERFSGSKFVKFIQVRSRVKTPLNLAPWTNTVLTTNKHPRRVSLRRVYDYWLWIISHPDTRYQTGAWHQQQRHKSRLRWRLQKLQATLRGKAPGAPAILRKEHEP